MDEKKKIEEPFRPEQTPNPPQIIDPSQKKERNEPDEPIESPESRNKKRDKPGNDSGNGTLLNEGTEINDETTI